MNNTPEEKQPQPDPQIIEDATMAQQQMKALLSGATAQAMHDALLLAWAENSGLKRELADLRKQISTETDKE